MDSSLTPPMPIGVSLGAPTAVDAHGESDRDFQLKPSASLQLHGDAEADKPKASIIALARPLRGVNGKLKWLKMRLEKIQCALVLPTISQPLVGSAHRFEMAGRSRAIPKPDAVRVSGEGDRIVRESYNLESVLVADRIQNFIPTQRALARRDGAY